MGYDVTLRGQAEPRLLSRVVRLLAWQGAPVGELNFRALNADDIRIHLTADCDAWRMTRILVHLRKIQGVLAVEACDSATGLPPDPILLPAPAAR